MNRSLLVVSTVIAILMLTSTACGDDEPFVNIKVIESHIYGEIKTFREANQITGPFVQNYPMTREAQLFSAKMASGLNAVDTAGISVHWDIIKDKYWTGYNHVTMVQSTTDATAAAIVENWSENPDNAQRLLGDYTQCAVGVEYDSDQVAYVTVLLMKIDS
jgi:hypothetical protein